MPLIPPRPPPGKTQKRKDGDDAEASAERYLVAQGFRPIQRNYRCRHGEIDLIMQDGDTIVFVEVRLRHEGRRSGSFGGAAASITAVKQKRIIAAARHWLTGKPERYCRFDVVLLDTSGGIEWIRDAFCE